MNISFEWVFISQEANDYDFNGKTWISYKQQINVGDNVFKFKSNKEVFEKCKNIKKFAPVQLSFILKSSQNGGNYLQLLDIQAKSA